MKFGFVILGELKIAWTSFLFIYFFFYKYICGWNLFFFPFMPSIDKKNYRLIVNRTTDSSKSSP